MQQFKTSRWVLLCGVLAPLAACVHTPPAAPEPTPPPPEEPAFRLFGPNAAPPANHAEASHIGGAHEASTSSSGVSRIAASHSRSTPRTSVAERVEDTVLSSFVVREEASLRAVVRQLQNMTGLPLVVPPSAEAAVFEAGVVFDFRFESELKASQLLNLISAATDGEVSWTIDHEAILFTTDPLGGRKPIVHLHDIRDLILSGVDFRAPRIGRLPASGDNPEEAAGGSERVTTLTAEEIVALVQENIAPTTWDLEGIRIESESGQLIVAHTADVQLRIQQFLRTLR